MKEGIFTKQFLYRYYGWPILVSTVVLIVVGFVLDQGDHKIWGIIATSVGALLSSAYFIQKQKIEETTLFIELFEKFNARYAELGSKLEEITRVPEAERLDNEEKEMLVRYFNLCAEEYLMYERGYIYTNVWRAWCHGMRAYFEHPRIKDYWREEMAGDSYYGLEKEFD